MATIVYPGRYDQLSEISKFVEEAAENAGFSKSEVYSIQLAVDEACANIINHAYGGEGKGDIACTCETDTRSITITLRDFGRPFNPDEVPLPKRHTDINNANV
ncbi:MAG TPA: ATP-binding protein, partial [Anaerolineaceae bacterium]|nr:ATP-binding protein [Anaerolineaceae bacterium]